MSNLLIFLVVNTNLEDKMRDVDRVRDLLPQPTKSIFCQSKDSACYVFPSDWTFEIDQPLLRELERFKYWAICETGEVLDCKFKAMDPAIEALGKKPANDGEFPLVVTKKRRKLKPR